MAERLNFDKFIKLDEKLYLAVKKFIEDSFKQEKSYTCNTLCEERSCKCIPPTKRRRLFESNVFSSNLPDRVEERQLLLDMLEKMDESFTVTLLKLIDLKGITDVECYKKANVSKQTWYKIMNEKDYKPSKNTVISFAIALELSLDETKRLLSTVGFTLSRSSKFDIIIEYFITNGVYDIFTINETLFAFDQVCLGV